MPSVTDSGTGSAGALSFAPRHKSCKDFYTENDQKAIENTPYDHLSAIYPMMCFCDPDGQQKPCRLCPKGHRGRVPRSRKILWAWPMFSWFALKYMKIGYMKKFFTDDYPRASLGSIALFSVLSVLVDAFTDPKMATATDNCRSKYGRRRPFIFFSAFFVPIVMILGWLPGLAGGSSLGSDIWFGVFHIGFRLCDTVLNIPFEGWGAQLTPIYKEKSAVWVWREVISNTGILFGTAIAPLLFVTKQCSSTPDDGCTELPVLAVLFGLLLMKACLLLVYYGEEPQHQVLNGSVADELGLKKKETGALSEEDTIPTLISTFLNWPFRVLLLTNVSKAVGQEIPFNVLPYMTAWVIGEKCFDQSEFFGYLAGANIVCGVGMIVPWSWLAEKLGKYRAYMTFNTALALTSLAFIVLRFDSGNCTMSYFCIVLTCMFGAAYGGSFLLKDLISDVVDYDELLSGGRRREASYLMAVEFVPKFMNIPGECVPFLMLAWFQYARPLLHQEACGAADLAKANATLSPDAFCDAFYRDMSVNECSPTMTCNEYLEQGVSFVCNTANEVCGIRQNINVWWVLMISFSVVPFICIGASVIALWMYPKDARTEEAHENLMDAITRLRRGEKVEDPWRPGHMVERAPPISANHGALSYLLPSELKRVLDTPSQDGHVDLHPLLLRLLLLTAAYVVFFIPTGIAIMIAGLDGLSSDLGASISPLGLMVLGIGIVGIWFHGTRAKVAWHLRNKGVTRVEVVTKYNCLCPFTGMARVEESSEPIVQTSAAPQEQRGTSGSGTKETVAF